MYITELPWKVLNSQWVQGLFINVLQQGPIPKHIAIIMDGNRRYARSRGLTIQKGHSLGALTLENTLDIAYVFGIKAATVYAFSIENFNRPKEQVDQLMDLFNDLLTKLLQPDGIIDRHKIRVQTPGRLELLNDDIRELLDKVVKKSAHNNGAVLNFCIAYTSRDEIARAVAKTVLEHCEPTAGNPITPQTLASNMDIPDDHPVDILIRTSGVGRLSDFLLWQCHRDTEIQVLDVQWPGFRYLDLFLVVLGWQRRKRSTTREYRVSRARKPQLGWNYASRSYLKLLVSIILLIVPVAWGYQMSSLWT